MKLHTFLLTCPLWCETFAKKEVQKQGYKLKEVKDKAIYFTWDIDALARINLWSRFGNIVYYVVKEYKNITNFDSYFESIFQINWKKYISHDTEVIIKATSIKSQLNSISSLQWIAKKAIVKNLVGNNFLKENPQVWSIEIRILIQDDDLKILLNSSGEWLHKRGYRAKTGEAPLKENIAAAIITLSSWKFSEPLYDIFCGSGTIWIEAAMIAYNIAPWLKRRFACESWNWIPSSIFETEKVRAHQKQFNGKYHIYCTDIDKEIIEQASYNAKLAWLKDVIKFWVQNYTTYMRRDISWWLISNPPYGIRLTQGDIDQIHHDIAKIFKSNQNLQWGIITTHSEFENYTQIKYKKRKLYNGWEQAYFYKKEK